MLTFGSLFAGIGGFDLGLERAGMECRWQVEKDPYCQKVLRKHWPNVGQWDDVCTFPPAPAEDWEVDLICGGFPCQDISIAGKGVGIEGSRSGLWGEFARTIRHIQPEIVVVENVAALLIRGMGRILSDLAELGFDVEWDLLPACAFGAPHSRSRVFLIADTNKERLRTWRSQMQDAPRCDHWQATQNKRQWSELERWIGETVSTGKWWEFSEAWLQRVDDGLSQRMGFVGSFGNAVVPQVAEWIGRRIIDAIQTTERGTQTRLEP